MPTILLHGICTQMIREKVKHPKKLHRQKDINTQTPPPLFQVCMHVRANSHTLLIALLSMCDFKVRSYCMILRVINLPVSQLMILSLDGTKLLSSGPIRRTRTMSSPNLTLFILFHNAILTPNHVLIKLLHNSGCMVFQETIYKFFFISEKITNYK